MCNRLPEINKNGDAGIFPVYYSLKTLKMLSGLAFIIILTLCLFMKSRLCISFRTIKLNIVIKAYVVNHTL